MKKILIILLTAGLLCGLLLPAAAWDNVLAKNLLNASPLTPLATGYTPLDRMVSGIFSSLFDSSASTYEKVKLCYDYVNTGASYQGVEPASSIYRAITSECNYYQSADMYCAARAYAFLTSKTGSCLDFADAFMVLMRAIGLECYVMHGTYGYGPHYWNLIKLSGGYYVFDTEVDWAISGRNGTSTVHANFCLKDTMDPDRSCDRESCIAEFGNFRCRNKTNTPGTYIPGTETPVTDLYTKGKYLTDEIMNFRAGPTISDGIYCEIPVGTLLNVTEIRDCWGKITYQGKTGWISLEYSTKQEDKTPETTTAAPVPETTTAAPQPANGRKTGVYVTDDALNFRSGPSLTAGIYRVIPAGTTLTVTEVSGSWGKTTYQNKTGWVSLDYCTYKSPLPVNDPKPAVMAGDADGNGKLTPEDARLILRTSVGLEKYSAGSREVLACDADHDGAVTPGDARLILRAVVGLEKLAA